MLYSMEVHIKKEEQTYDFEVSHFLETFDPLGCFSLYGTQ